MEEANTRSRLAADQAKLDGIQRQLERLANALATTEQQAPETILNKIKGLEKQQSAAEAEVIAIAREADVLCCFGKHA